MSKLSFRARALDASKPMPIYMAEELPDLPDYSAINRAVPQMPSGMEKEEECEHHLQRAICAGLLIPTPEVSDIPDQVFYDQVYPANYKQPRQLIHMQPFTMEQDIPDYDMDSEDERWLQSQTPRLDLSPLKFEEMMDRLEKSSGQTVVTLQEAKALLKEDDDLTIAVFDYWLNKRLKMQHPLILTVKTEQRAGTAANNPYLAFRRRTEKMQTRKNRKNDETSYEKMLKLRRDLVRTVTLLEFVKKREKLKRENVSLTLEIFSKRYLAKDFSGAMYAEASAIKTSRPAFTPIFHNHYTNQGWSNKAILKDEVIQKKEKRQYKKRKHKSLGHSRTSSMGTGIDSLGVLSSDEESVPPQLSPEPEETEDEGLFAFKRNKLCSYHEPLPEIGNWPWCSKEENGLADKRYRFTLTSLSNPRRCIGFARRRVGRGGRVILDRIATDHDDFWRTLDFSIVEPNRKIEQQEQDDNNSCILGTNPSDLVKTAAASAVTDISVNNIISNNNNNNNSDVNNTTLLRTDIKSEFSNFNINVRTSVSDIGNGSDTIVKVENDDEQQLIDNVCISSSSSVVKTEQPSTTATNNNTINEDDELVNLMQKIQKEWLHFRPKTPPSDYEPPCNMLPASESYFVPSANTSFSVEVQSLDPPSHILDSSTFITDPFIFDNLDCLDVPVTDTRQQQQPQQQSSDRIVQTGINLNVNVGLNTLTSSTCSVNDNSVFSNINNLNDTSSIKLSDETYDSGIDDIINNTEDSRTFIGCSRFRLSDCSISSTSKINSSISLPLTSSLLTSTSLSLPSSTSSPPSSISSTNTAAPLTSTSSSISSSLSSSSSTLTSPKFNNVNSGGSEGSSSNSSYIRSTTSTARQNTTTSSITTDGSSSSSLGNTNGLRTQFGLDGRTKNNKLSYAYPGGVGYSNASSGTLSLHTSAHTLTLNSHSANNLEITIADDGDSVSNKLVNSQCTESGTSAPNNNKTKSMVRKNNIVMEVT